MPNIQCSILNYKVNQRATMIERLQSPEVGAVGQHRRSPVCQCRETMSLKG